MTRRYAIYAAPSPDEAVARMAASWLGWDPEAAVTRKQPEVPELSPDRLAELTREPRRYGFHATLKPPFGLMPTRSEDELLGKMKSFAETWEPVQIPQLELARIGKFLALRPNPGDCAAHRLADACVEVFDSFRAPATEAELARRRTSGLSARQEQYLLRWGYPYVFEEFRLHFTLTGRIPDDREASLLAGYLTPLFAPLLAPLQTIREICLFQQDDPALSFRIRARFPLKGLTPA